MTSGLTNADENNGNAGLANGAHDSAVAGGNDVERGAGRRGDGDRCKMDGGVVQLRPIRLPSAPASETVALLGLIERAAADPGVDLDRMERMYAMYERAAARSAKSAYLDALMAAKAALPRIIRAGAASYEDKKTGEAKKAFSYAKWEEAVGQIEPVLAAHSLMLTFTTEQQTGDRVAITGVLSHRDGHSERAQMALGCDASGGKNNAQGWGSAISYGKRYTAFALLNLVGHDDKDTDGAPPPADTTKAIADLKALVVETKSDVGRICQHFSVETLDDLSAAQISQVVTGLKARQRQGAAK